jgi:hypothetical protein
MNETKRLLKTLRKTKDPVYLNGVYMGPLHAIGIIDDIGGRYPDLTLRITYGEHRIDLVLEGVIVRRNDDNTIAVEITNG